MNFWQFFTSHLKLEDRRARVKKTLVSVHSVDFVWELWFRCVLGVLRNSQTLSKGV